MLTIEMAIAAPTCIPVNGSITDSINGLAISGVYVRNASNISAAATADTTDTTGTDGFFNFTCMFEDEVVGATSAADRKIWLNASGYTEKVIVLNLTVTNASYFGTTPGIANAVMTPITPVNGAVTVSSITKNSATVAWTTTMADDNVSNSWADQRLIIMASGVPNITQAWTNSTLVNSYSLSNLMSNQKYTYYALAYNTKRNTITDQDTSTFTTLKAGVASSWTPEPVTTAASKKSVLDVVAGGEKTTGQRNIIIVAVVAIICIIVYFGYYVQSGKSGGKQRRR